MKLRCDSKTMGNVNTVSDRGSSPNIKNSLSLELNLEDFST